MLVGCSIVHYIIIQQEMLHVSEQKEVSISSKVSFFQGLNCLQETRVSLLEKCPHFTDVLREGFHECVIMDQRW